MTIPWGSVNESDMAHMTYPSADIVYLSENVVGDDAMAQYGFADAEIEITLRCKLSSTSTDPKHTIDAQLDIVLNAVKTALLANNGALELSNRTCYIVYKGFEKVMSPAGDIFIPGQLKTKWNVRYQN